MERNNLYILKFIDKIGCLKGRKKLQKLIFILEYLGLPTKNRFHMHYYGPYSSDLALELDSLVEKHYLKEIPKPTRLGVNEYWYELTEIGRDYMQSLENITIDEEGRKNVSSWAEKIKDLHSKYKSYELELAATILYWIEIGHSPDKAKSLALEQKNIPVTNNGFRNAVELIDPLIHPF